MEEVIGSPFLHEVLKTSGPMGLVAMAGWAAWYIQLKRCAELEKQLFKLFAQQVQSNNRLVTTVRALRETMLEIKHDRERR